MQTEHTHTTCMYQSDGIVLPRLCSTDTLNELIDDYIDNQDMLQEATIYCRAVSEFSESNAALLIKRLKDNGVNNLCIRGGFDELNEKFQNNNNGISVVIHTEKDSASNNAVKDVPQSNVDAKQVIETTILMKEIEDDLDVIKAVTQKKDFENFANPSNSTVTDNAQNRIAYNMGSIVRKASRKFKK